jgi:hypothetical protein
MPNTHGELPAIVPTLSRGKHRNARKGACFMEFASYLAGERWSDHPHCTHALLAEASRLVNDHTSDANRGQLAPLIPSVIGLNSDSSRFDARISLTCAQLALPIACADRQKVLAVSILAAERMISRLDDRDPRTIEEASEHALALAPDAAEWAYEFIETMGFSERGFRRQAAPATVRCAIVGIAQACVPDADARLRTLLTRVIDECTELVAQEAVPPTPAYDQIGRTVH